LRLCIFVAEVSKAFLAIQCPVLPAVSRNQQSPSRFRATNDLLSQNILGGLVREPITADPRRRSQHESIASRLREAASLHQLQGANRFRVNAYRRAADTLESLDQDVGPILQSEGFERLTALPGISPVIATAIIEIVNTGQWSQLERLGGVLGPDSLFQKLRGIGLKLAHYTAEERSASIH
jgi:hypothetical protein